MKEWLSVKELAEKTTIPENTVRRYIDRFNDFFTSHNGNRSKRYEKSALKILAHIKNLYDGGYKTEQIDIELRKDFAVTIDGGNVVEDGENAVTQTTSALATNEEFAEMKKMLQQQGEAMAEQRELLAQQQEFNKLLVEKLTQQETYIKETLQYQKEVLEKQNKAIEKRDNQLMESVRDIQEERRAMQKALEETATAIAKVENNKPSFLQRLFGK
ncbi:MerR family transcriptional regulator [Priestia megaterium]|uniref:MerR family transcriptional regulator n=1 Tax=Priestia megaterium TaxID=1404 RepID=UPI0011B3B63F|nr:MerR family transcriptional regulator [Priestia megaterium]QDZ88696.1 MerR family transcriptional regulator [Priestia megaterium]